MTRIDPLRNFHYRLEIDNITQAGFSEVTIPETPTDAVDYREGTSLPHVRKPGGLTKSANITLKRGVTVGAGAMNLAQWHQDVSTGQVKGKRKKVVIVTQDEAGSDTARFVINGAWPVKYAASELNAEGNEVTIEVLELANEGIEREK